MKSKFSTHWRKSSQIRKQRKYLANAPRHIKSHIVLKAHLSKDLRKKYGKRSFPVRKGDEVKIMRGSFEGKTGKILLVNHKRGFVAIEGIQRKKKDGTKINVIFNASNLMIKELDLGDKRRLEALTRKATEKKQQAEKPKKTETKKEKK